jgi:hypothetical protein
MNRSKNPKFTYINHGIREIKGRGKKNRKSGSAMAKLRFYRVVESPTKRYFGKLLKETQDRSEMAMLGVTQ